MSDQRDLILARPFQFNPNETFGARESDPPSSTLASRLASFFQSRPLRWVDGRELMTFAGSYGWRTRISEIRRSPYNMRIDNRQRRVGQATISEYMFLPAAADGDLRGAA